MEGGRRLVRPVRAGTGRTGRDDPMCDGADASPEFLSLKNYLLVVFI
jgi:hypothetical protein